MEITNVNRENKVGVLYGANSAVAVQKLQNETMAPESTGVVYESGNSVEGYGLYTETGVSIDKLANNHQVQNALHSLGFYSGPTDGNLKSESCIKAIKNFQTVYGLCESGTMNGATKTKLNKAYTMKSKIANSNVAKEIDKAFDNYTMDYMQRDTFANTWVFLRVGMGLTVKQTAGVCGNIMNESVFSADNAQDRLKVNGVIITYPGVHNKKDYSYNIKDGVGYGLIQWTFSSRKKALKEKADSMELGVSNLNVQLAFFREEMLHSRDYKEKWKEVTKAKTVKDVSDAFLREIENPDDKNYTERRVYGRTIYKKMKELTGI